MKLNLTEKISSNVGIKTLERKNILNQKNTKAGTEISCLDGKIWITQSGDDRDRILTAGDKFRSMIPGRIIAQALDNTRIKVDVLKKAELSKKGIQLAYAH